MRFLASIGDGCGDRAILSSLWYWGLQTSRRFDGCSNPATIMRQAAQPAYFRILKLQTTDAPKENDPTRKSQPGSQRIRRPHNSERCGTVDQSASIDPQILTEECRTSSQPDDVTYFLAVRRPNAPIGEVDGADSGKDISSSCLPL